MRRPRLLLGVVIALASVATGCPPPGDDDAGIRADGGALDAGPRDAGNVDAGLDAGGASDGGQIDAGVPFDEDCVDDGCVRAAQPVGDFDRQYLRSVVPATVVIDNGYTVYWVRAVSQGREFRVVMTVPLALESSAPPGGYHTIVNAPGTVGLGDDCAIAFGAAGAGLAGTFGARGYVGVSLDYPGIGTDGPHPYLVAASEGAAVLHAAAAALDVLEAIGVATSGRVALVGLSQGGHAVLSAARLAAESESAVDIAAVAAAGPATLYLENWAQSANAPGDHIIYHALLARAWEVEYGHPATGERIWSTGTEDIVDRVDNRCVVVPEGVALGDAVAIGGIGEEPSEIFTEAFSTAFASGDAQVLSDAGFAFVVEGFAANRVRPWAQAIPMKVYQGVDDDVVLASRIENVVADLRNGGMEVEFDLVDGGGHTDVAFSFLSVPQLRTEESLAWLAAQFEAN